MSGTAAAADEGNCANAVMVISHFGSGGIANKSKHNPTQHNESLTSHFGRILKTFLAAEAKAAPMASVSGYRARPSCSYRQLLQNRFRRRLCAI